jgi:hypothetical protein
MHSTLTKAHIRLQISGESRRRVSKEQTQKTIGAMENTQQQDMPHTADTFRIAVSLQRSTQDVQKTINRRYYC